MRGPPKPRPAKKVVQYIPDLGITIKGRRCTIRIFLRTDGLYASCEDRGEDWYGCDRYVTKATSKTLEAAKMAAAFIAGADPPPKDSEPS